MKILPLGMTSWHDECIAVDSLAAQTCLKAKPVGN